MLLLMTELKYTRSVNGQSSNCPLFLLNRIDRSLEGIPRQTPVKMEETSVTESPGVLEDCVPEILDEDTLPMEWIPDPPRSDNDDECLATGELLTKKTPQKSTCQRDGHLGYKVRNPPICLSK
jgi:hypothetical protein